MSHLSVQKIITSVFDSSTGVLVTKPIVFQAKDLSIVEHIQGLSEETNTDIPHRLCHILMVIEKFLMEIFCSILVLTTTFNQ